MRCVITTTTTAVLAATLLAWSVPGLAHQLDGGLEPVRGPVAATGQVTLADGPHVHGNGSGTR